MTFKLRRYQRKAVSLFKQRGGRAGFFAGMGTGKTITTIKYLNDVGARTVVVALPLSAVGAWRKEFARSNREWETSWRVIRLTTGPVRLRASMVRHLPKSERPTAFLVNYAAFWRQPLKRWLLKIKPDSVIADEAHRLKGRSTRQSKFAADLSDEPSVKNVIALTGSLAPDSGDPESSSGGVLPEDVWAIYRFINPRVFKTWGEFESRYLKYGGYGGYKIVGYRHLSGLYDRIARTSFRISKEEALPNLPPRRRIRVPVALSGRTLSTYKKMQAEAIVRVESISEDGRKRKGVSIAQITLVETLRLQQIASGFIPVHYDDDSSEILYLGEDKLRIAVELTEDAIANGEKVVLFCRFRPDVDRLKKMIKHSSILDGSVKGDDKRAQIVHNFNRGNIDALVVQIATGAESIELVGASVAIYVSYDHSLITYNQSRDRLHRHGQKRRVLEYLLIAEHTVDEKIVKSLRKKQDISRQITTKQQALDLLR